MNIVRVSPIEGAMFTVGTSVPTLCPSRAEYTARRAGRTGEMPFNLLPTCFARLYPPALNAISAEFSMGGAAVITPMGP